MPNREIDLNLWLQWLLANILGTIIGWYVGTEASSAIEESSGLFTISTFIFTVTLGASVGLAQYLVLRTKIGVNLWILASILGWGVGWPVSRFIFLWIAFRLSTLSPGAIPLASILGGSLLGLIIGLSQWLILRKWVCRSSEWIIANVVGAALGNTFTIGIFGSTIAIAVFLFISSSITGSILVKLFHQTKRIR